MRLLTVFFLLLCCSGTCSQEERTSLGEGFLVKTSFGGPVFDRVFSTVEKLQGRRPPRLSEIWPGTYQAKFGGSEWVESDGVMEFEKMTCCYSIKLLEYMSICSICISSYYTQNCVHGYRTCLCRVYAYAKYSTKKLIDPEFLSDVWCNFQFLCIFYMSSLKNPPLHENLNGTLPTDPSVRC